MLNKKKLSFEEWWKVFKLRFSSDDEDSLGCDFERCWKEAQENI
jgi:hypothetical protein